VSADRSMIYILIHDTEYLYSSASIWLPQTGSEPPESQQCGYVPAFLCEQPVD
jgi:hypothetical protein